MAQVYENGDVSLPTESVSISSDITLYYDITSDPGTFAVVFDIPNQFWAIGWGADMSDADVWTFEIVNNQVEIKDTQVSGHSAPTDDTNQDLTLVGYQIGVDSTTVKFTRPLDTTEVGDVVLEDRTAYNVIWAT